MNFKKGFTLIEVLIALIIIAIALAASIRATNQSVRDTTHVQNTLIAHWVGMNIISEIQIGMMKLPVAGNIKQGHTAMLGREWQWTVENHRSVRLPGVMRIQVVVSMRNHAVSSVVGYA